MITARAPATCANLGSGFDAVALALATPVDRVSVEVADETTIAVSGIGADALPTDPSANTAGIVADVLGTPAGISIEKGIRPASGLGSSGASAIAAAVALNRLYDLDHEPATLIDVAAEAEGVIAGSPHADNVAAAMLGGYAIVSPEGYHAIDTDLAVAVCLPDVEVRTDDARGVVPADVTMDAHVDAVARVATLTIGMCRADPAMVGAGMVDDLVTPHRERFIPGFASVRRAALGAGATGVAISGAGPALVAACPHAVASGVATAMRETFVAEGIDATAFATAVGGGASIEP
ncbi:MAG: homoserine kinase [Halobacteriota archaeon]